MQLYWSQYHCYIKYWRQWIQRCSLLLHHFKFTCSNSRHNIADSEAESAGHVRMPAAECDAQHNSSPVSVLEAPNDSSTTTTSSPWKPSSATSGSSCARWSSLSEMQLLYHIMHVSIMLFFVQITKFHASLFSKNKESFLSSLEFHRLTSYLSNALSLTKLKQATSNLKREKGATVKEGQKKWQVSLLPIIIIYVCTLYLLIPHSPDIGQLSKGTDSFLISFIRKEQWSVVYRFVLKLLLLTFLERLAMHKQYK